MNRTFQRILLVTSSVLGVLSLILVVHIYQATRPSGQHHNNWQLARIDFAPQESDPAVQAALAEVQQYPGVEHAFLNQQDNILVYGYTPGTLQQEQVLESVRRSARSARPFTVANTPDSGGRCPINDRASLAYRFTTFFKNLFHK